MSGKLLRSTLIGLIVRGLLLALMSSLRQWQSTPTTQDDAADDSSASYNTAVRHTASAVMNVYNRVLNDTSCNQLTLGSRVIMDQHGYILANKHVINDASQITVALQDGRVFEALPVGFDILTNLVVLKINAADGLPVILIDPKRTPYIGDVVLAIGNPRNPGQIIAQGIISTTGRIGLNLTGRQNFLQTDASISHGNSSEALVNSFDKPMGTNTLSFDKSNDGEMPEGISFVAPFRLAAEVVDKLIQDGRMIHDYIGISGREIVPLHAQDGGIDQIQETVVNDVAPDGPTVQAGARANDVIVSVNDKPTVPTLKTMDQVAEIRPGPEIPIAIMRDDKKITLHTAVQEYPATN